MKVLILKDNLTKALSIVGKGLSQKPQLPILSHILLKAHNNQLEFYSTNLELGIIYSTPAKVEKDGEVAVPGKLLTEFISSLFTDKIELESTEKNLSVKTNKTKGSLAIGNPVDFPPFPETSVVNKKLALIKIKDAVLRTVFAASTDEGRPVLTGVKTQIINNKLLLSATDGYRLSKEEVDLEGKADNLEVILPAQSLLETIRIAEVLDAKEIDFLISCSYGPGRYDPHYEKRGVDYPYAYVRWTEQRNMQLFIELIEQGKIDLGHIISQEFALEKAEDAYKELQNGTSLGLVLRYAESNYVPTPWRGATVSSAKKYSPPHGILQVAIVGVGGFAKIKLLPILAGIRDVRVRGIVDVDAAAALSVARHYKATVFSGGFDELIARDDIQAVIIATPHQLHAQQTMACLQAGLAVFVEKPATVTKEQFTALERLLASQPDHLYCVDFNRSFSPFMRSIKSSIATRRSPLMIYYRMNAGFIPTDHWVQAPEHGGRIIGEACHILELFCYLTDAAPRYVSVTPLQTSRDDFAPSDNVSVVVQFSDGSVCTLLYTALGNSAMPKEQMELYVEGKSIIMNDYVTLQGFGLPVTFNKKHNQQDKGHAALLERFIAAAQHGGLGPIPFERIAMATKLSFIVDQLARSGGGYHQVLEHE